MPSENLHQQFFSSEKSALSLEHQQLVIEEANSFTDSMADEEKYRPDGQEEDEEEIDDTVR